MAARRPFLSGSAASLTPMARSRHYLDLGDPSGRAVEVSAQGWSVVDRTDVQFQRPEPSLIDLTLDMACGNVWRIHNRNHDRDGGDESVNGGCSEMDESAAHAEFRENIGCPVILRVDVLERPVAQRPRNPRNGIGMNARAW
jgi:hypothetical protein